MGGGLLGLGRVEGLDKSCVQKLGDSYLLPFLEVPSFGGWHSLEALARK